MSSMAIPEDQALAASTCGALTRGRTPCAWPRGYRTNHAGAGRCWLHGGATPNGRLFAQREAAENMLKKLGYDTSAVRDPVSALANALRVAAWREKGLRQMLEQLDTLTGSDHLGDERERAVSVMHREALNDLARIAKLAIDADLAERLVQVEEHEVAMLLSALLFALEALGLTEQQINTARAVFAERLRVLAGSQSGEQPPAQLS
jgi:hypothetical protein